MLPNLRYFFLVKDMRSEDYIKLIAHRHLLPDISKILLECHLLRGLSCSSIFYKHSSIHRVRLELQKNLRYSSYQAPLVVKYLEMSVAIEFFSKYSAIVSLYSPESTRYPSEFLSLLRRIVDPFL